MQAFLHALEKKQVLTVEMFGAFLEFINLKKLNNSFIAIRKLRGMNLRRWFSHQKHSIRDLSYHIRLSILLVAHLMTLLQ